MLTVGRSARPGPSSYEDRTLAAWSKKKNDVVVAQIQGEGSQLYCKSLLSPSPSACHKDPATSTVSVIGYTKLHCNSFTISIFHIANGESVATLGSEFCWLHAPIDILVSTFSENFIFPEDIAHIAAPFRNDGFPDDLYRHFFLQVGGPIQSIEQWLQGWSSA